MKKFCLLILSAILIFTMSACTVAHQEEETNVSDGYEESLTDKDEFEIVFKDFDGSVLKTETIKKGEAAKPPVGLKRDDYKHVNWDQAFDNVKEDMVITAVYEEIKEPTLIVDTVYSKGEDVVVKVHMKKNPGILSLLLNTIYVENAMKLTKIESGKAMSGYTFVEPKNLSNACNAAWYTSDVPDKIADGEVALLHFQLNEDAAPGAYKISVSCDNGAFDSQYEEVEFEIINGYVIVESEEKTK